MSDPNEVLLDNVQNDIREQEKQLKEKETGLKKQELDLQKMGVELREHEDKATLLRRQKRQAMDKIQATQSEINRLKGDIEALKRKERIVESDIRQAIVGKTIR